jgi:hypothetical protein
MKNIRTYDFSKSDQDATHHILPCPHCDQIAELTPMFASPWWRVRCIVDTCGATTWAFPTQESAISAWNRGGNGTVT